MKQKKKRPCGGRKKGKLACRVDEGRRTREFFDDGLGQFAALATFTGNTQFGPEIGHGAHTIAAQIANLVVSYLAADTDVHRYNSPELKKI